MHHEDHQNRIHAVVTEALGGLIANDVRNARRHLVGLERRGQVRGFCHRRAPLSWSGRAKASVKFSQLFRCSGGGGKRRNTAHSKRFASTRGRLNSRSVWSAPYSGAFPE